jgi:arginase
MGASNLDLPFEPLQAAKSDLLRVVVLGVPSDENSTFMRGAAQAPARIRELLHAGSMNLCAENGLDLSAEPRFGDLGDLELDGGQATREQIEGAVAHLLGGGACVLSLGGDHAITYPILRAYARHYRDLNVLHLDAHPDLYEEYDGNRYSHACPFARIMEEGLAAQLVQVGIRTMNPHQQAQAERFGVEVVDMQQWRLGWMPEFTGPVYLSLDMDVLDPAYAPGVAHHEPGGLTTRDLIGLIHSLAALDNASLVGADIVEANPQRDPLGITAMTAAKLLKEIAACMLEPDLARG